MKDYVQLRAVNDFHFQTAVESIVNCSLRLYLLTREEPRTATAPTGGEEGAWDDVAMSNTEPIAPYSPQHIANFFLQKAELEGTSIDQLKLMKLVYIAYGWYLALTGRRLYAERIEAWKHGPVVRSIYDEFKDHGRQPIARKAIQLDLDTWEQVIPVIPATDRNTIAILERVWAAYRRFSGWALRQKTHEIDGPWHRVYVEGVNAYLRDADVREHYRQRIREYLTIADAQASGG